MTAAAELPRIIETAFDAEYAAETAKRMLILRGKELAIARCNESIAKGANAPGGAAFWGAVLAHINASSPAA